MTSVLCIELDLALRVERLTLENEELHLRISEWNAACDSLMKERDKGTANSTLLLLSYYCPLSDEHLLSPYQA